MHYVKAQLKKGSGHLQCVDVVRVAYHKYGLKYLALFLALSIYSFVGAGVFLFFEKPAEIERLSNRQRTFEDLRQTLVHRLLDDLFNDTEKPIIFVDAGQIEAISRTFSDGLQSFEDVLNEYNSKHSMEPLLRWDLWTALIYAWTVITTIGYGHLFPLTVGGRIATMLYAVVGIPLMLTVLSNVGKLLTKVLKYPFFLVKRWCRRIFSYCTKMTREQILEADEKDLSKLEVFDLPIPVAIALVIGWIFICSAITLIWEDEWDYLVAFYFFFISLSTIGFGDVVPGQPYYLLLMFGNTMIGMALVSMLLNLIQGKLEPISIEEDPDAIEMDRNGLRRAFRRVSMFTSIVNERQGYISYPKNGGEVSLKVPEIEAGPGNLKQQKAKTEGMTGGVAVSALSAFLAPLFSALAPSEDGTQNDTQSKKGASPVPSIERKEMECPKSDAQDQLVVIDENKKESAASVGAQPAEKDEAIADPKFRPLRKTVSFQANELSSLLERNFADAETSKAVECAAQVTLATKSHPSVRAVALIGTGDGISGSSVRLRRMDGMASLEKPRRKKKSRFMSMREGMADDMDRGERTAKNDLHSSSHRQKHRTLSKRSLARSHIETQPDPTHPKASKMVSSATLPLPGHGGRERGRLHRTDGGLGHSEPLLQPQDTHSTCSICTYDPLHESPARKKHSKRHSRLHQYGHDYSKEPDIHRGRRGIQRQKAIDESFDTLPDDEASLFACLDAAIAADVPEKPPSRHGHSIKDPLWHRHSISTDAAPDFFRSVPLLTPASSDQQHLFNAKSGMSLQNTESQTMISFPSQDSDSRISITSERGTARLLPVNVPFTEINRLVDLNIKAAILRNELESLAMVESAPADISDYEHVLSLHEVMDQMNHEATLPRR